MSSKVTSTTVGKVRLRTSVFLHYSLTETVHVANTAEFHLFSEEANTTVHFSLNAADTQCLIASLQQHLEYIRQAEVELATIESQAA